MATDDNATPATLVFADKGTARPASGLQSVHPRIARTEIAQAPAAPSVPRDAAQNAAADGELLEAASLAAGGFNSAKQANPTPPAHDPGMRDTGADGTGKVAPEQQATNVATAGPADIDSALAEFANAPGEASTVQRTGMYPRSDILRQLIVGAAFVAPVIMSMGTGYGISQIVRGDPTEVGTAAPAAATRTVPPR